MVEHCSVFDIGVSKDTVSKGQNVRKQKSKKTKQTKVSKVESDTMNENIRHHYQIKAKLEERKEDQQDTEEDWQKTESYTEDDGITTATAGQSNPVTVFQTSWSPTADEANTAELLSNTNKRTNQSSSNRMTITSSATTRFRRLMSGAWGGGGGGVYYGLPNNNFPEDSSNCSNRSGRQRPGLVHGQMLPSNISKSKLYFTNTNTQNSITKSSSDSGNDNTSSSNIVMKTPSYTSSSSSNKSLGSSGSNSGVFICFVDHENDKPEQSHCIRENSCRFEEGYFSRAKSLCDNNDHYKKRQQHPQNQQNHPVKWNSYSSQSSGESRVLHSHRSSDVVNDNRKLCGGKLGVVETIVFTPNQSPNVLPIGSQVNDGDVSSSTLSSKIHSASFPKSFIFAHTHSGTVGVLDQVEVHHGVDSSSSSSSTSSHTSSLLDVVDCKRIYDLQGSSTIVSPHRQKQSTKSQQCEPSTSLMNGSLCCMEISDCDSQTSNKYGNFLNRRYKKKSCEQLPENKYGNIVEASDKKSARRNGETKMHKMNRENDDDSRSACSNRSHTSFLSLPSLLLRKAKRTVVGGIGVDRPHHRRSMSMSTQPSNVSTSVNENKYQRPNPIRGTSTNNNSKETSVATNFGSMRNTKMQDSIDNCGNRQLIFASNLRTNRNNHKEGEDYVDCPSNVAKLDRSSKAEGQFCSEDTYILGATAPDYKSSNILLQLSRSDTTEDDDDNINNDMTILRYLNYGKVYEENIKDISSNYCRLSSNVPVTSSIHVPKIQKQQVQNINHDDEEKDEEDQKSQGSGILKFRRPNRHSSKKSRKKTIEVAAPTVSQDKKNALSNSKLHPCNSNKVDYTKKKCKDINSSSVGIDDTKSFVSSASSRLHQKSCCSATSSRTRNSTSSASYLSVISSCLRFPSAIKKPKASVKEKKKTHNKQEVCIPSTSALDTNSSAPNHHRKNYRLGWRSPLSHTVKGFSNNINSDDNSSELDVNAVEENEGTRVHEGNSTLSVTNMKSETSALSSPTPITSTSDDFHGVSVSPSSSNFWGNFHHRSPLMTLRWSGKGNKAKQHKSKTVHHTGESCQIVSIDAQSIPVSRPTISTKTTGKKSSRCYDNVDEEKEDATTIEFFEDDVNHNNISFLTQDLDDVNVEENLVYDLDKYSDSYCDQPFLDLQSGDEDYINGAVDGPSGQSLNNQNVDSPTPALPILEDIVIVVPNMRHMSNDTPATLMTKSQSKQNDPNDLQHQSFEYLMDHDDMVNDGNCIVIETDQKSNIISFKKNETMRDEEASLVSMSTCSTLTNPSTILDMDRYSIYESKRKSPSPRKLQQNGNSTYQMGNKNIRTHSIGAGNFKSSLSSSQGNIYNVINDNSGISNKIPASWIVGDIKSEVVDVETDCDTSCKVIETSKIPSSIPMNRFLSTRNGYVEYRLSQDVNITDDSNKQNLSTLPKSHVTNRKVGSDSKLLSSDHNTSPVKLISNDPYCGAAEPKGTNENALTKNNRGPENGSLFPIPHTIQVSKHQPRISTRLSIRKNTVNKRKDEVDRLESLSVLLFQPVLKIFEIVSIDVNTGKETVGTVLEEARSHALDHRLGLQEYTGLCCNINCVSDNHFSKGCNKSNADSNNSGGDIIEVTDPTLPISEILIQLLQSNDDDNNGTPLTRDSSSSVFLLVAIPEGSNVQDCLRIQRILWRNPTVKRWWMSQHSQLQHHLLQQQQS